MTSEQFVFWLKGMVAANNGGPPHAMVWAAILDELNKVQQNRPWPTPYVPNQPIGPLQPSPCDPPYVVTCGNGAQT